jgi:2-polyprenyl-3-methyl-5-hydroxy-6-metoxy-1,4-benzoquinol methylase
VYSNLQYEQNAELDQFYDEPYRDLTREQFLRATAYKAEVNRFRKKWLDDRLHELNRAYSGGRALEIGCKDGSFLRLLKEDGWTTVGVDPNKPFAKYAEEINGVRVVTEYFHERVAGSQPFDLIAAFDLIEHIQSPVVFLRAVKNAIKDNGLLYFETPDLRGIHRDKLIDAHVILYTQETLSQLLASTGFRVIACEDHGPGPLTFDYLIVLAEPCQDRPQAWREGNTYEKAKSFLETSMKSTFPSPSKVLPRNRLFHIAQKLFGEKRAEYLKALYLNWTAGRRTSEPNNAATTTDPSKLSSLVREAYLQGRISRGHVEQLGRLDNEFLQLKVLARIKASFLSEEETKHFVDGELRQLSAQ